MPSDLDSYLEPVVTSAVEQLQVYERQQESTDSYELDIDNALVTSLSKVAYSQIVAYLDRSIATGAFVDIYTRVAAGDLLQIRNFPVSTLTSVTLGEDSLTEGEDFILEGGRYFQLCGTYGSDIYSEIFTRGLSSSSSDALRITYVGGWDEADLNTELHSGLVSQTVAMYHRKDTLGIGSIKGSAFDGSAAAGSIALSAINPDAGGLVSSARIAVDRYKFYGTCITMELD